MKVFLSSSEILNIEFDDYNAQELGKTFAKNNLFTANHSIRLSDNSIITSPKQWSDRVKKELEQIEKSEVLNDIYKDINTIINKNAEGIELKKY